MVCVFLSFMLGDQRTIKEFGFGLGRCAVFLDAIVVRCVLLPAVLELLGAITWRLPGRLDSPAAAHQHRRLEQLARIAPSEGYHRIDRLQSTTFARRRGTVPCACPTCLTRHGRFPLAPNVVFCRSADLIPVTCREASDVAQMHAVDRPDHSDVPAVGSEQRREVVARRPLVGQPAIEQLPGCGHDPAEVSCPRAADILGVRGPSGRRRLRRRPARELGEVRIALGVGDDRAEQDKIEEMLDTPTARQRQPRRADGERPHAEAGVGSQDEIAHLDHRDLLGELNVEEAIAAATTRCASSSATTADESEIVVRASRRSLPTSAISIPGDAWVRASRTTRHEPTGRDQGEHSPEQAGIGAIRPPPDGSRPQTNLTHPPPQWTAAAGVAAADGRRSRAIKE